MNAYRNDLPRQNWINVRPVGVSGNRGATGAKIRLYAAGTQQLLWYEEVVNRNKQVLPTYYAYGETERHFGLGPRTSVDVAVLFYPSNKLVRKDGVAANATVRISEDGTGVIVPPMMAPPPVASRADAAPAGADGGLAPDGAVARQDGAVAAREAGSGGTSGAAPATGPSGAGGAGGAGGGGEPEPAAHPHAEAGGCGCRVSGPRPARSGGALVLLAVCLLARLGQRRLSMKSQIPTGAKLGGACPPSCGHQVTR
jgi:hypothetical protein